MWETWVGSLDWEDPLDKELVTHSSILALIILPGESHGQRSLAGYSPWGHKESDRTEQLPLYSSVQIDAREWGCWIVWQLCF